MKKLLYIFIQCTWGIIQTLFGLVLYIRNRNCEHFNYHGARVTLWGKKASISLGVFVFVARSGLSDRRRKNRIPDDAMRDRLLVHEYGHTIQSLLLGPFYLILIGIPSALWGNMAYFKKKRENGVPYSACFTERSANRLGEWVTKEKSLRDAIL